MKENNDNSSLLFSPPMTDLAQQPLDGLVGLDRAGWLELQGNRNSPIKSLAIPGIGSWWLGGCGVSGVVTAGGLDKCGEAAGVHLLTQINVNLSMDK